MVEEQALFEWSPEVALNLGVKFCSWVVPEDANEDLESVCDEDPISKSESLILKKSIAMGRPMNGSLTGSDQNIQAHFV